jgi:hypothetical protein
MILVNRPKIDQFQSMQLKPVIIQREEFNFNQFQSNQRMKHQQFENRSP